MEGELHTHILCRVVLLCPSTPWLQTKLSNPHYKPEIAAQTTLVNFCVTEKGLEDQLLALVVDHERPDLQVQGLCWFFVVCCTLESLCMFWGGGGEVTQQPSSR